jgi:hypothetical protein
MPHVALAWPGQPLCNTWCTARRQACLCCNASLASPGCMSTHQDSWLHGWCTLDSQAASLECPAQPAQPPGPCLGLGTGRWAAASTIRGWYRQICCACSMREQGDTPPQHMEHVGIQLAVGSSKYCMLMMVSSHINLLNTMHTGARQMHHHNDPWLPT